MVENDQFFNNILNTIIFSIFEHEKYQSKLNLIYANQLNDRLFEIIDFRNLSKMIQVVNKNDLNSELFIPNFNTIGNNKFIRSFSQLSESYLTIFIHFPVLYKKTWNIWNIVPIPTWHKNILLVMNESRAEIIRNGSTVYDFRTGKSYNL